MMRTSTFRLTGEFIAESCGGRLVHGPGVCAEAGVSIDSRTVATGQAFLAVRGPRFDGHDFLAAAIARGAAGLIVDEARAPEAMEAVRGAPERAFVVAAPDTVRALTSVATAWAEVMAPTVVAITGSVGKSTTKDLCGAICATRYDVLATSGNLNNRLGLSLTCLKLAPRHEALVVEMGMNAPGEIAELCGIARPTVGVVTCVAAVHLERLGTLDAVARAKAELVERLPPEGKAVLNADDERVARMRGDTTAAVLTFGTAPGADVRIAKVSVGPDGRPTVTLEVRGEMLETRLALVGAHHAYNAAAALAAGLAVGVDPAAACAALETVTPGKHRMTALCAGTIRVIDDCYNASPKSVAAALDALKAMTVAGRRVAVLGDMLELGGATEEAHVAAGRDAAAAGAECLVAVGRNSALVRRGAIDAGLALSSVFEAPDNITAASLVVNLVKPRDTVLVKGSRGVGLEHVVDALVARFGGAESQAQN